VTRTELLSKVDEALVGIYGRPSWHSHGPAVDELIATVLSQHTSDVNAERAFASLRSRYPDWSEVAEAPTGSVADAIRCGGLADLKAPKIQRILRELRKTEDGYSLEWLTALPLRAARSWLTELPGVGPKTASCVLLFSLGLPAMPVDTHVHRVCRRLGLIGAAASAEAAQDELETLIGPVRDAAYALHLNLIRHGRETCRARNPGCHRCVLANHCPHATLGTPA
jgi:endonuclease-3